MILFSKVNSQNDELSLEIYNLTNNVSNLVGKISIPFDDIESQEEFECNVEIPEESDSTRYNGAIKLKIQYIKSYYKYYSDLALEAERSCIELMDNIKKIHQYFENLNRILFSKLEPFSFNEELNRIQNFKRYSYESYFDNSDNTNKNHNSNDIEENNKNKENKTSVSLDTLSKLVKF